MSRIEDIENKIGGGLIEEVIQVAQGELKLVDTMIESKAYVLHYDMIEFLLTAVQMGKPYRTITKRPMVIL